jgi:DNA end-binding protein Ku
MAAKPRKTKKKAQSESPNSVSARPFWSGTLTFGLVSVPVDLYPANRSGGAPLRMLGPDGKPLRRRYHAEGGRKMLEDDEIVRGFEYADGRFVVVSDEELERLAPEKSRDIELKRFVPADEVDPLYFERGYFLAPSGNSNKAYRLLAQSMEESGRAGLATFVMREKEYIVAIFSENGVLRAETLRFRDEIREPSAAGLAKPPKIPAAKVKTFERLIAKSTKRSLPASLLEDERAQAIVEIARKKKARGEDVFEVEIDERSIEGAEVVDLMAVLRRSLERPESSRGGKKRAA